MTAIRDPTPPGAPSPASAATTSRREKRRFFLGHRWLTVVLRGLHLVAIVWLGATLHSAPQQTLGIPLSADGISLFVLISGLMIFALDLAVYPQHLREIAGLSVLLKLVLVGVLLASEELRLPIFWLIMLWSALFSHAPGSFRHHVLIPGRRQVP